MKVLLIGLLTLSVVFQARSQNVQVDSEKLLGFYQQQKYSEAAGYLSQIYPSDREDIKLLGQIAYFKFMAGDLSGSEGDYLKILQLDSNNLSVLVSLARIHARRNNSTSARKYLEKYIEKDTLNFSVYKQLAAVVNNDTKVKITYLKRANLLNPVDAEVANDLAENLMEMKDYKLAEMVLNFAISKDTTNLTLLRTKLPVCYALDKLSEVAATGEKLMSLGETSTFIITQTGKAYVGLQKYDKALAVLRKVVPGEQTESSLYYTTICYKALNNYKEAIKYANLTIDEGISPNIANYHALLGALHESNLQSTLAAVAYRKGLNFKKHEPIFYNLALLYDLKLKNKVQAIVYYKKYLANVTATKDNAPERRYVQQRLAELK